MSDAPEDPSERSDRAGGRGPVGGSRPPVLATLVRRGEDFAACRGRVAGCAGRCPPGVAAGAAADPRAWLTTVAARRLIDARRSDAARRRRTIEHEPPAVARSRPTTRCCCSSCAATRPLRRPRRLPHPAGGGRLTTGRSRTPSLSRSPTMAQRISRAKRTLKVAASITPATSPWCSTCCTWSTPGHTGRSIWPPKRSGSPRQLTSPAPSPKCGDCWP